MCNSWIRKAARPAEAGMAVPVVARRAVADGGYIGPSRAPSSAHMHTCSHQQERAPHRLY